MFKSILEVILFETNLYTEVSETGITSIANSVFNAFYKSEFANSNSGKEILRHLLNLVNYRANKEPGYTFPDKFSVLQNFIAFIIKPYNND